jgi:hypothetical protein
MDMTKPKEYKNFEDLGGWPTESGRFFSGGRKLRKD